MKLLRTIRDMRNARQAVAPRERVGLVPTMGAFHEGHLSLMRAARRECDYVVASLFVNPIQFGDPLDLSSYPRDEVRDAELAEAAGVDCLFVPAAEEMYPPGFATRLEVGGAAAGLEGAHRPGHFNGVATVCLKLFSIVGPDRAFFGQKDAQQVAVVTQMIRDLNLPLEIRVMPTVRDVDGLALSSRNVRLAPDDRVRARAIPRALAAGVSALQIGDDPIAAARAVLSGVEVDYVAVAELSGRPTLLIAARVGGTRLIDNVPLDEAGERTMPLREATHAE